LILGDWVILPATGGKWIPNGGFLMPSWQITMKFGEKLGNLPNDQARIW
jgi:hypothetical protein